MPTCVHQVLPGILVIVAMNIESHVTVARDGFFVREAEHHEITALVVFLQVKHVTVVHRDRLIGMVLFVYLCHGKVLAAMLASAELKHRGFALLDIVGVVRIDLETAVGEVFIHFDEKSIVGYMIEEMHSYAVYGLLRQRLAHAVEMR